MMRGLAFIASLRRMLGKPGSNQRPELSPNLPLPHDYLDFLQSNHDAEGWLGEDYFILWRADELQNLNDAYQAEHFAPGIFLFGSDGGGDAWGFDLRVSPPKVVRLPFVGMDIDRVEDVAGSFSELLQLSPSRPIPAFKNANKNAGMELFEIKPIIFGGSPTDPANKEWKSRHEHIQLVKFWNQMLKDIVKGQKG